jgi:phasin family protein
MQAMTNPALDTYQQQIDASRHIAEAVFDGTDRMEHLMLDATRKAFDERMKFYQALAAARDPQGVAALQSAFFSHTPEQMLKVQQEVMKIVTESQDQINKTMQHYKLGFNGQSAETSMPSNSENAQTSTNALTSLFHMWDKAFKDTVALTTGSIASTLAPVHSEGDNVVNITQKPAKRRNARAK